MIQLRLRELIHVAERTLGRGVLIRVRGRRLRRVGGEGRGSSAPAGPQHALVDGHKLGLATTIAFLGVNGQRLMLSDDQASRW